jgi:hypothetical protein
MSNSNAHLIFLVSNIDSKLPQASCRTYVAREICKRNIWRILSDEEAEAFVRSWQLLSKIMEILFGEADAGHDHDAGDESNASELVGDAGGILRELLGDDAVEKLNEKVAKTLPKSQKDSDLEMEEIVGKNNLGNNVPGSNDSGNVSSGGAVGSSRGSDVGSGNGNSGTNNTTNAFGGEDDTIPGEDPGGPNNSNERSPAMVGATYMGSPESQFPKNRAKNAKYATLGEDEDGDNGGSGGKTGAPGPTKAETEMEKMGQLQVSEILKLAPGADLKWVEDNKRFVRGMYLILSTDLNREYDIFTANINKILWKQHNQWVYISIKNKNVLHFRRNYILQMKFQLKFVEQFHSPFPQLRRSLRGHPQLVVLRNAMQMANAEFNFAGSSLDDILCKRFGIILLDSLRTIIYQVINFEDVEIESFRCCFV